MREVKTNVDSSGSGISSNGKGGEMGKESDGRGAVKKRWAGAETRCVHKRHFAKNEAGSYADTEFGWFGSYIAWLGCFLRMHCTLPQHRDVGIELFYP